MMAREGSKAAEGDVNVDVLPDVYIVGAAGQGGQLYLQTPTGGFVKKKEKAFEQFADLEDVAVLLFDCDHDGDLDLLVGPGGNQPGPNSRQMQLRFNKNNEKRNFTLAPTPSPNPALNFPVPLPAA